MPVNALDVTFVCYMVHDVTCPHRRNIKRNQSGNRDRQIWTGRRKDNKKELHKERQRERERVTVTMTEIETETAAC